MKVRCKSTGVYFQTPIGMGHGFTTMDVNKATRFVDTPKIRAWFTRNYAFELEFMEA